MRNRISKKLILVAICASMLMSACGRLGENTAPEQEIADEVQAIPRVEFESIFEEVESFGNFIPMCCSDGEYYGTITEKSGEDIPEAVITAAKKNNEEVVNDGRYDVIATVPGYISEEKKLCRIQGYKALEEAENVGQWRNFSSVSGISGIAKKNDHLLLTLEYQSISGITTGINGGAAFEYHTQWFLRTIGIRSGHEFARTEIVNPDGLYFNGAGMMIASDGSVLLTANGPNKDVACYISQNGEILSTVEYGGNISGSIFLNNGYYAVYGERNGMRTVSVPDFSQRIFGDYAVLPENTTHIYSGYGRYAFFFDDGLSVYGYVLNSGTAEKIFSWSAQKINSLEIISDGSISMAENGSAEFLLNVSEQKNGSQKLVRARLLGKEKTTEADVTGQSEEETEIKEEKEPAKLTILTAMPSAALAETVAEFNSRSGECRAEIIDCSQAASEAGTENAIALYISEKTDGVYPDIIDLSGTRWKTLAQAGFLENLYPFLEKDRFLSAEDYFPGVLSAAEYDGKLCITCAGFYIDTMIGSAGRVGNDPGLTYDEIINILTAQAGSEPFEVYAAAPDVFLRCLRTDMGLFVDEESGTCSFNTAEFISLLKFAGQFPQNYSYDFHVWDDLTDNSDLRVRSGKQLLLKNTLYSMTDLMRAGYEFDEEITFTGCPTISGNGNAFTISSFGESGNFAMCSGSNRKDAAWSFLRTYFTEEYQKKFWFIPSNVREFNRQLKEAMQVYYYLDDNGKPVIGKKTKKPVEIPKGSMYLSNFTEIKYYAVTEERADKIHELITGTEKTLCRDEVLLSIISSCANEFFMGRTSAETAAENIQNYAENFLQSKKLSSFTSALQNDYVENNTDNKETDTIHPR